ncbi:MAG: LPS export ABC transporter permease LptG [Pseudomonadota bacterium]
MTLHRYFAMRYLRSFGAVFVILLGLAILLDLMEQIRRFAGENVSFGELFQLAALSAPVAFYQTMPLVVIIAALTLFLGLARTSELVVARASGRSAMRSLIAPVVVTLALGGITVALFNPMVASMAKEYEARTNAISDGSTSTLSISGQGLWLRQGNENGQTVIRALSSDLDGTTLRDVTFVSFSSTGDPVRRVEASTATLKAGGWDLSQAKVWPLTKTPNPELAARYYEQLRVPSELTREGIRDSFGSPSAITIWELPEFISQLERAGFSARRHLIWFHMEIALPVFMVAMLLIGAAFTMRHNRSGKTGLLVLNAILLGFAIYFIRNFAQILGENGQMPVLLAAWAPPLGAIGLALGLLLHLEDG